MRAVRIHKFGSGPQDLVYEEDVMQPHSKEGEVLVKVYATGVTPNEIVWIWYHPDISLPIILGHELSGIIEEVGPKVTNQRVGDAVYGLTDTLSSTRDGAEAEYVITIDSEMAPKATFRNLNKSENIKSVANKETCPYKLNNLMHCKLHLLLC
jgi:NADPH:quinone reductase-like Zn-dependent oxidoreductase